jgi:hypothetical protein
VVSPSRPQGIDWRPGKEAGMPFKSKAQSAACYARRAEGTNGSWDCSEWSHVTNYKRLPKHVRKRKKSAAELLGEAAARVKRANVGCDVPTVSTRTFTGPPATGLSWMGKS